MSDPHEKNSASGHEARGATIETTPATKPAASTMDPPATQLAPETWQRGWLAMVRSEDAWRLMRDPYAFTLLGYIAFRARYTNHLRDGIGPGQMYLGRDSLAIELGQSPGWKVPDKMTAGKVRGALKRLQRASYIAVKGTKDGSVITLLDASIYDIPGARPNQSSNQHFANPSPAPSQYVATNEEGKIERREKRKEEDALFRYPHCLSEPHIQSASIRLNLPAASVACLYQSFRIHQQPHLSTDHGEGILLNQVPSLFIGWCENREVGRKAVKDARVVVGGTNETVPEPFGWRDEFPNCFYPTWAEVPKDSQRHISGELTKRSGSISVPLAHAN